MQNMILNIRRNICNIICIKVGPISFKTSMQVRLLDSSVLHRMKIVFIRILKIKTSFVIPERIMTQDDKTGINLMIFISILVENYM